mmetsp:Transcript_58761/g.140035  ORF Transcript_58761/g.140035 Transcript_58761/m.140035 type:complete len:352 (-) Transcript_58761:1411-2466(-)
MDGGMCLHRRDHSLETSLITNRAPVGIVSIGKGAECSAAFLLDSSSGRVRLHGPNHCHESSSLCRSTLNSTGAGRKCIQSTAATLLHACRERVASHGVHDCLQATASEDVTLHLWVAPRQEGESLAAFLEDTFFSLVPPQRQDDGTHSSTLLDLAPRIRTGPRKVCERRTSVLLNPRYWHMFSHGIKDDLDASSLEDLKAAMRVRLGEDRQCCYNYFSEATRLRKLLGGFNHEGVTGLLKNDALVLRTLVPKDCQCPASTLLQSFCLGVALHGKQHQLDCPLILEGNLIGRIILSEHAQSTKAGLLHCRRSRVCLHGFQDAGQTTCVGNQQLDFWTLMRHAHQDHTAVLLY